MINQKSKQGLSKLILGIIILIVIIGLVVLIYFIVSTSLEKKIADVTGRKASVSCAEKDIEFNLSCEYVQSGPFYNTTVKFKRTDSSGLEFQKLFALISYERSGKLEEISTQNLFSEQEYNARIYRIPENFQFLGILNDEENCRTPQISCVEKIVETQQEPTNGNETQTEGQGQQDTTEPSVLDQIEQAIENAFS